MQKISKGGRYCSAHAESGELYCSWDAEGDALSKYAFTNWSRRGFRHPLGRQIISFSFASAISYYRRKL
jgi:hypothetical protein